LRVHQHLPREHVLEVQVDLTPEQADIVGAPDIDLGITAGAGTGKTHVLVERYVALLERCAIPEIVAITFTEAAAAEMRQRVRREVLTRPELQAHRASVDDAIIGTIHSLCLRILREHPVEAAIDPAVAVLGEDEAELLRLEACAAAVDAAAEAADERTAILGALGVFQTTQLLPSMVAARSDVSAAFAVLPDDPAEIAATLQQRVDEECERALGPLRRSTVEALDDLRPSVINPSDKLATVLEQARAALGEPQEANTAEWWARLRAARDAIDLRGGSGKAWSISVAEARAVLRSVRDEIDEACKQAQPWNEFDDECVRALPGLRALFEDACGRYESLKHESHGLDFLDLEVAAVSLLEAYPGVTAAYRRAWRHLMVDEAQDVSGIQARLIRALAGEAGVTEERPRLFLVGDEKQSIYRFRGAQVRQFRELRRAITDAGGRVLPLSASFRTHAVLVEQSNALFEYAFAEGEVTMERMSGRPGDPPEAPHLAVIPVEREGTGQQKRLAEADLVADEIAALLASGRPVWDKRARAYRPARPGDVAILMRRYRNVHLFEQALEAHGVPFATPSGTGFFTRPEVLDLTNLLRWLVEPEDQIALFGVLRSPLFVLRDDTILQLRARRRPMQYALREPPADLPADERARCEFASRVLDALRARALTASAADLVEAALIATGYEASWAPISGGEQALANIRKFVRLCRDLSSYTTAEVVTYLERRRDELVTREGPAVLDRPDAVQIMTVHGAKGLEFPVVFVPEAHAGPMVGYEAVRWRAGEGIAFTLDRREGDERRPQPAIYALLTAREQRDEEEEHLRLLYVAVTRAGDYVYLSGEDTGERGWMPAVQRAMNEGDLRGVEYRAPEHAPTRVIARRPARRTVTVPPAEREEAYTPPLLARPPVIPLRTSTPATALRTSEHRWFGRGDGLGLVRGTIVHRVIEVTATLPADRWPEAIAAVVAEEGADLDAETRDALAGEAAEMLERFRSSPAGRSIEAGQARFEVPFAWDWDGIPVHGQIDLLYQDAATDEWWVVDFKTDRVSPGGEPEAAQPYLVQLGVYAGALEAATGRPPRVGLLFLRTGALFEPEPPALRDALVTARERVDGGMTLATGDDIVEGDDPEA
jgi:ATP-dependent helicase/nuclease subunit A